MSTVKVIRKSIYLTTTYKNSKIIYLPDSNPFSHNSFTGNKVVYVVSTDGYSIGRDARLTPSDISIELTDDTEIIVED